MEMRRMFVSESEIEEKRRKRQEEWEKVRTADQPEEAPEEEVDHRSLFDRLQEQKTRKQEEWEESRKLKNLVRGIDSEESDFLGTVDEFKEKLDREKRLEEERELKEFHIIHEKRAKQIDDLPPSSAAAKTSGQAAPAPKRSHQQELVLKGVKRKLPADGGKSDANGITVPALKTSPCRVMLPGMDCYEGSSSDESDSDDEQPRMNESVDLLGRRNIRISDEKRKTQKL